MIDTSNCNFKSLLWLVDLAVMTRFRHEDQINLRVGHGLKISPSCELATSFYFNLRKKPLSKGRNFHSVGVSNCVFQPDIAELPAGHGWLLTRPDQVTLSFQKMESMLNTRIHACFWKWFKHHDWDVVSLKFVWSRQHVTNLLISVSPSGDVF